MRTANQMLVALAIKKLGVHDASVSAIGWLIVLATEDKSFNRMGVYTTVRSLEENGWAAVTTVLHKTGRRERQHWRLTAKGEAALVAFGSSARHLADAAAPKRRKAS